MIKQEVAIPKKVKDLESFTFPCHVESKHFDKAMCDFRSGISLKPTNVAIACEIH